MSAIGVSVQINLHETFTGTKTFDLNESLLLRHRQDFPLRRDSEAIYSSKALWRSMLAVIIQLIGYERSRAALLTPRTLLEDQRSV